MDNPKAANLYTLLLNTGLQTRDNPTYQVLHSLIDALLRGTASTTPTKSSAGPPGPPGATGPSGPAGPQGISTGSAFVHTVTAIGSDVDIANMFTTPFVVLQGTGGFIIVPITVSIVITCTNGSFSTGRAFTLGYSKTIGGNTYGQNAIHVSTANLIESGLVDPRYIFIDNYECSFDFNTPGGGEGSPVGKSIVMVLNGGGTGYNTTGTPHFAVMTVNMTYQLLDGSLIPVPSSAGAVNTFTTYLNSMPVDGEDGLDGIPGVTGARGIQGIQGALGPILFLEDGIDGLDGVPGIAGLQGIQGLPGINGLPGIDGEDSSGSEIWIPPADPRLNYSFGTWTPADNSGASLVLTVNDAVFVKLGSLVMISFSVTYPVTASVLQASIKGLPFITDNQYGIYPYYSNANVLIYSLIQAGTSVVSLYTGAGTALQNTALSATIFAAAGLYRAQS